MAEKQISPIAQPRRPRNAAVTREAILNSALAAFSRKGYDGIGVREIAQAAGVTAVLVNRYFGSKEELFAATVELAFADSSLFEGEPTTLAKRLAAMLMTKTETEPNKPFFMLLRSAPNPRAAEILRESIARRFERPLTAVLEGPNASQRAAMILAAILGIQLMRRVIGIKALADANAVSLSSDLETMFQRLIDSSAGRKSPTRGEARATNLR